MKFSTCVRPFVFKPFQISIWLCVCLCVCVFVCLCVDAEPDPAQAAESEDPAQIGNKRGPLTSTQAAQPAAKARASRVKSDKSDREKRQHAKISTMKVSKEMQSLLSIIVKSQLWTAQILREMIGIIFDSWIVLVEEPIVISLRAAGKKYSQQVRARGKGHQLGCPAIHFFHALICCLTTYGDRIGAKNLAHIKLIMAIIKNMSPDWVFMSVRQCKLHKVFDSAKLKLSISLIEQPLMAQMEDQLSQWNVTAPEGPEDQRLHADLKRFHRSSLRMCIRGAMEQIDQRYLSGRPPQGALEELLQASLDGKK